nr:zinc ABC transporter substrate-binding protein [Actinomycetota bacterium]
HDYEPTAADVQNIAEADVVVKNGLGLEKWFDDTLKNADSKAFVVDASANVIAQKADGSPASGDGHDADPHIWQNPLWARVMVHNIALAFEREDSDNADAYATRAAAYEKKLTDLDAEITAQLAPLTNRKVVTNHDAFGYYLTHYRLQLVGSVIPSFDTQAELSAKDVAALVSKIKATKVKAIFAEAALPAKTAEAIGKEAGVKVVAGDDALYGDSLGPSGSDGGTYIGAIRHNTKVFVDNLK